MNRNSQYNLLLLSDGMTNNIFVGHPHKHHSIQYWSPNRKLRTTELLIVFGWKPGAALPNKQRDWLLYHKSSQSLFVNIYLGLTSTWGSRPNEYPSHTMWKKHSCLTVPQLDFLTILNFTSQYRGAVEMVSSFTASRAISHSKYSVCREKVVSTNVNIIKRGLLLVQPGSWGPRWLLWMHLPYVLHFVFIETDHCPLKRLTRLSLSCASLWSYFTSVNALSAGIPMTVLWGIFMGFVCLFNGFYFILTVFLLNVINHYVLDCPMFYFPPHCNCIWRYSTLPSNPS